jgi:hypothetical protein
VNVPFVYRQYPGENPDKGRPPCRSKELALRSFLGACDRVRCEKRLIVAVDAAELPGRFGRLLGGRPGRVLCLGGLGNAGSHLEVMDPLVAGGAADTFYVSEDDCPCRPAALVALVDAMVTLEGADDLTLYDHPDLYTRSDDRCPPGGDPIRLSSTSHWRSGESTCMTFGGRREALRQDAPIHRRDSRAAVPRDRRIWHETRGLGRYLWRFPKRSLLAPLPSLATHLEPDYLAPFVDWEGVARSMGEGAGG